MDPIKTTSQQRLIVVISHAIFVLLLARRRHMRYVSQDISTVGRNFRRILVIGSRNSRKKTHERDWFKVRVNDGAGNGGGIGSRDYRKMRKKKNATAVYDISPHWPRRKLLSAIKPPRFLRFLYDGSGVYASLERTFVRTTNVADVTSANYTSTLAEKSQRDFFFFFFF